MSSNLSSNTLFHYTRRFDNFKKILNDGFRPNYSLENFEFLFEEDTNIANHHFIPMVCFCDIPISSAKEHIKNYGNYAIGLSRKWGEDNGLNPVMYISRNSKINKIFRYAYSSYNELDIEIEKEKNELLEGIKKLKYEDIGEDIINKLSKKNGKKITKQNFEESIKNFVMQCFSEDYLLGNSSSLNATYNDLIYKNGMIKERIHKLLLIANNAIKYVLFIKPFIDKTETIKYYDEKEWRYVPDVSKQFIECPNKVAMEVEKMGKKKFTTI